MQRAYRRKTAMLATAPAMLHHRATGVAQGATIRLFAAREGFFYVGGKATTVNGHTYMAGQMYVDVRIPAKQTHPYPIIMVHGGTRSATTYFGTPDGREGWAAIFRAPGLRRLCGGPARARDAPAISRGLWALEGADGDGGQRRYLSQAKYKAVAAGAPAYAVARQRRAG